MSKLESYCMRWFGTYISDRNSSFIFQRSTMNLQTFWMLFWYADESIMTLFEVDPNEFCSGCSERLVIGIRGVLKSWGWMRQCLPKQVASILYPIHVRYAINTEIRSANRSTIMLAQYVVTRAWASSTDICPWETRAAWDFPTCSPITMPVVAEIPGRYHVRK